MSSWLSTELLDERRNVWVAAAVCRCWGYTEATLATGPSLPRMSKMFNAALRLGRVLPCGQRRDFGSANTQPCSTGSAERTGSPTG